MLRLFAKKAVGCILGIRCFASCVEVFQSMEIEEFDIPVSRKLVVNMCRGCICYSDCHYLSTEMETKTMYDR